MTEQHQDAVMNAVKTVCLHYDIDFEDALFLVGISRLNTESADVDASPPCTSPLQPIEKTCTNETCMAYIKTGSGTCSRKASTQGFCKIHYKMKSENRLRYGYAK